MSIRANIKLGGKMGTLSLLIFYIFIGASGGFAAYCSTLSLKKAVGHIEAKQHFSAFTFYLLYIFAAVISSVIITATVAEILLLLTGQALSLTLYSSIMGTIILLTVIATIAVTYKPIIKALTLNK